MFFCCCFFFYNKDSFLFRKNVLQLIKSDSKDVYKDQAYELHCYKIFLFQTNALLSFLFIKES